jgi:hypothetical protein
LFKQIGNRFTHGKNTTSEVTACSRRMDAPKK